MGLGFAYFFLMHSKSAATIIIALSFAGFGIWCTKQMVNAFREAMSAPLETLFEFRPQYVSLPKQPLTETEQNSARDWLGAFETTGLLDTNEVTLFDVLDRSEHDDQSSYGLADFLHALSDAKPEYRHLAFFFNGVEFSTDDAKDIVLQFARLAERQVINVEVKHIAPIREDRGQESIISFDLEGERHQISFIMYVKVLPWDLIEDLARCIVSKVDEKRFELTWSDSIVMLTLISRSQRADLERLVGTELFNGIF
jgi:hypothetical protein